MFLITFDEGGGLFDHVPPPKAKPPSCHHDDHDDHHDEQSCNEMDFNFCLLGQRVPFLAISSSIRPQTIIKKQVQHSSLIRSLCKKFKIKNFINLRDRHAPLYPNQSLFRCKKPREWPDLFPQDNPFHCVIPGYSVDVYRIQKKIN